MVLNTNLHILTHPNKMILLKENIVTLWTQNLLFCLNLICHLNFLDDALSTAFYLINRLPTTILHDVSPLEKLFGQSLTILPRRFFDVSVILVYGLIIPTSFTVILVCALLLAIVLCIKVTCNCLLMVIYSFQVLFCSMNLPSLSPNLL